MAIWSVKVGASVGANPLTFGAVSPVELASTTAAVAVTGVVTGTLVTEKACADHKTQSPKSCTLAESEVFPALITEDTVKVSVSHSGPSFAAKRPGKESVPRFPVKLADVWAPCGSCPAPTMNVVEAANGPCRVKAEHRVVPCHDPMGTETIPTRGL